MYKTIRDLAACALLAATFNPMSALAADGADFFKDKTVTYIVPTAPGGGYDYYGRLVAEFMQRHLPGSTFVVRNMPGAGHIIGVNAIAAAKPDGLTLGIVNQGLIYNQLVGTDGIKFDLAKLSWVGKAAAEPRVFVISALSPIKTFADLKSSKVVNFSSCGVGCAAYVETRLLTHAMRLPINLMPGYNGNEDQMAMRRGEIDANFASYSAFRSFVENGYGKFLFAVGGSVDGVPQLRDLVKDQNAETTALLNLLQAQGDIARLTAGPPGIPDGRLEVLRAAYKKTFEDADFKDKAKQGKIPLDPAFGADVERMVKDAMALPPDTADMVTKLVRTK